MGRKFMKHGIFVWQPFKGLWRSSKPGLPQTINFPQSILLSGDMRINSLPTGSYPFCLNISPSSGARWAPWKSHRITLHLSLQQQLKNRRQQTVHTQKQNFSFAIKYSWPWSSLCYMIFNPFSIPFSPPGTQPSAPPPLKWAPRTHLIIKAALWLRQSHFLPLVSAYLSF